jgi:integrase
MKANVAHETPLPPRARAILKQIEKVRSLESPYVFPGFKIGKPLSNVAMLQVLKRMGRRDITVHGFRSTFRNWAAECTNFKPETCEWVLAHGIDDAVEAAYNRTIQFNNRIPMMTAWQKFIESTVDKNVIRVRRS